MAQWGRNDQAVTANSTTTKETSNGAPIGTYVYARTAGGANAHFGNTSAGSRANVDVAMFNNTTPSAFITGQAVGVFGVSATEHANNNLNASVERGAHAGWNLRRAGTGSIVTGSFTSNSTTLGYNNADVVAVKSPVAGGNAAFSISTNATGGSLTLTLTNAGFGFNVVSIPTSNVFITNATGGTAAGNTTVTNFVVTAGGRAGRVHYETLVAMGSLGAQTAAYGTPASVADATSDNTLLPGV
jgi:hypothetical protein